MKINFFISKKGSVAIFLILAMVTLIGITSLVVDIGAVALARNRLQAAVDSAALAGALSLPNSINEDGQDARDKAIEYLNNNTSVEEKHIKIDISENKRKISVEVEEQKVDLFLAPLIGVNSGRVTAKATAIKAPARASSNLYPIGVIKEDFQIGEIYTLTFDPSNKTEAEYGKGKFGYVNLWQPPNGGNPGGGAKEFNDTLKNSSKYYYSVGDTVYTFGGLDAGPFVDGINDLLKANGGTVVIVVPLFETMDVTGTKRIEIMGFAAFEITSVSSEDEDSQGGTPPGQGGAPPGQGGTPPGQGGAPPGQGSNISLNGKLVDYITIGEGDESANYSGVWAVNLVE